jgi:cell division septation protein DedD
VSRVRPQPAAPRPAPANRAARLTARDYKGPHQRPFGLARLREFGWGVLAGALLTAMAFTWMGRGHRAGEAPDTPRPEPHRGMRAADAEAAGTAHPPSQKFDFYEMLPNFEVVVPERDKDVKRDLPAAAKIERPGVYVLQAGSYRNEADADRVRAQLALQGINAKVQRVAVDADVWHRVRIGPVSNLDDLNRLRRQLQAADVDALVIRVGD